MHARRLEYKKISALLLMNNNEILRQIQKIQKQCSKFSTVIYIGFFLKVEPNGRNA
jgi:hypothetical protein